MATKRIARAALLAGLGLGGWATAAEPVPIPVSVNAPVVGGPVAYPDAGPSPTCTTCGGAGGGCADGSCGAGGNGLPKCGRKGIVIDPRFESHYIKKYCAPTICPGSCFGYYQTKWAPWQAACPQWQAGVQGYDPSLVFRDGSPLPNQPVSSTLPAPITPPRLNPDPAPTLKDAPAPRDLPPALPKTTPAPKAEPPLPRVQPTPETAPLPKGAARPVDPDTTEFKPVSRPAAPTAPADRSPVLSLPQIPEITPASRF